MKSDNEDITALIADVERGDQDATTKLFEYCFPRLLRYSRDKLPRHLRKVLDEEDVALSAFKSFCFRAQDGSLGEIGGRDALWRLLFCITSRKAQGYVRHQTRLKRGGGRVGGESTFRLESGESTFAGINEVPGQEARPTTLSEFQTHCRHLFDMLEDETLQTIALLRVEGHSVDEIAVKIGCAKRSVERRLKLIRTIWNSELPAEPSRDDVHHD